MVAHRQRTPRLLATALAGLAVAVAPTPATVSPPSTTVASGPYCVNGMDQARR